MVGLRLALIPDAKARQDARQGDGRRALNVVIEAAHLVPVLAKQVESSVVAKILELQEHVGLPRLEGAHKLVEKGVVGNACGPLLPQTAVSGVRQQGVSVGAHVKADGQAALGGPPRRGGVKLDLALAYAHAPRPEVAKPQDALAVRHDDRLDVLVRPRLELSQDASPVLEGEVEPGRLDAEVGVLLAGLAHGGGVDEGQDVLRGVHEESVVLVGVGAQELPERHVLVDARPRAGEDLLGSHRVVVVFVVVVVVPGNSPPSRPGGHESLREPRVEVPRRVPDAQRAVEAVALGPVVQQGSPPRSLDPSGPPRAPRASSVTVPRIDLLRAGRGTIRARWLCHSAPTDGSLRGFGARKSGPAVYQW